MLSKKPPQPLIQARELARTFSNGAEIIRAVHDVNLDIAPGHMIAIVGRSGSGKTTLLNLLSGLDRPTAGYVLLEGQDLHQLPERDQTEVRRRKMGFIFQSFGLLPLLSAFENVELPLRIAGASFRQRRQRSLECLDLVGLTGRLHHRPYELSGGEQQRVALARAIANHPRIIFADEPTGELDSATALSIYGLFQETIQKEGVTIITATHDLALAALADVRKELVDGTFV